MRSRRRRLPPVAVYWASCGWGRWDSHYLEYLGGRRAFHSGEASKESLVLASLLASHDDDGNPSPKCQSAHYPLAFKWNTSPTHTDPTNPAEGKCTYARFIVFEWREKLALAPRSWRDHDFRAPAHSMAHRTSASTIHVPDPVDSRLRRLSPQVRKL